MARNSKTVPFTNPPPTATTPADDFATLEQPTDPRLLSMLKFAMADLRLALVSQEHQMRDDMDRILEEDGDDEKGKPKFKLGISLTLDLKNNDVDSVISYSIKVTEKRSHSAQADDGTRDMFSESEREGMARE